MKFKVDREPLVEAAKLAASVANKKSPLPVHSRALLRADGDGLTISAFDGHGLWSTTKLGATVNVPGEVCVDAALFASAIGSARGAEVSVEHEAEKFRILLTCGRARWRINVEPADDFAAPPAVASDPVELDGGTLGATLAATITSASTDTTRSHMNAVLLCDRSGKLEARATDGHTAAMVLTTAKVPSLEALVPLAAATALRRWLEKRDAVSLRIDGRRLSVEDGGARLVAQLADDRLPPLDKLVPKHKRRIRVVAEDLVHAIDSAAKAGDGGVEVTFGPGRVTVAKEGKAADGAIELDCDATDECGFMVDPRYLGTVVRNARSDEVELGVGEPLDPILVTAEGYTAIVMPMKPERHR